MDSSRNDTEIVARFVAHTHIENIPDEVLAAAKSAILDCWGGMARPVHPLRLVLFAERWH